MPPLKKADLKAKLDSGIEKARRSQRRARSPISKARQAGREDAFQDLRVEIFGEKLPVK